MVPLSEHLYVTDTQEMFVENAYVKVYILTQEKWLDIGSHFR